MLEWASPLWFLALPLAVLPVVGLFRPWALRFSSFSAMRGGRSWRSNLAWVPALAQSAVLVLVLVALARPQRVMRETERESEGVDIVLAIDTSGSMRADDMGLGATRLTRLQAGQRVMAEFVDQRPNDRIALVVFGEEAFTQVPLTLDHVGLDDFIGQLEVGLAGKSATAVGDAIAVASKRLKELKAPSKVIILVTDGKSNSGQIDPVLAAEAAAALGIRVYTIGVGASGAPSGLLGMFSAAGAEVDERTLGQIASVTGGQYFRATDTRALAAVYARIDELEPSTARVKEYVHRDELFLWWLGPALTLLLLDLIVGSTLLRRIP
ncbi:MAG: VWA domain-containing protein [Myxococcales bacterium]|nr:VWA domain-containing protein [Myxococcales bacterium]